MTASQRQEFCVRWNSHLGSIGAAFPQLLAGQRFVDVTLACEGHQVHCHRLVLAACSSYFESILAENPCKHPVIILPSEIKLWEIQALVDFMYKGEVNVTQAGLPQLLRCAEQLRIRGLYGSDAALNLNQLKALSQKVSTAGVNNVMQTQSLNTADSVDEDTATSSTITSQINQNLTSVSNAATAAVLAEQYIKKEPMSTPSTTPPNATVITTATTNKILQQQQQQLNSAAALAAMMANANASASNLPSADDDDSGDDSNSNNYEQYEMVAAAAAALNQTNNAQKLQQKQQQHQQQQQQQQHQQQQQQQQLQQHHLDSTVEEDHNYTAHDEDDSYGTSTGVMVMDQDSVAAMQNSSIEGGGSMKRVRRSEASLAQAAKCVSKGQTFQTVSNIFNIPVSTIRFYMARKGILPKRKRGRGASSNMGVNISGAVTASNVAAVMSQALAQIKGESDNSNNAHLPDNPYNNSMSYKLEPGTAHMI
ncbi:protein bric-a-brac 2 [Glossina fuscipes]|uniref:Protein bric-a-brac 2 n=1 Tax=Glossina fuscipes TaxID=7396 RepID=A0A9C5Z8S6_9MUSC|nr:protein bric-a-brac 2 [Glossina fuscipes]XP_037894115.1 protein bric-a-brac 2 [Glossina fuscipes]XP_037894121.1 protein bric-a-brac 2 [Glossina fuscipes]XP_037894132.1 protein bric-a-brac 2 [Glossina fuscipes]XP_037894137.1 protein bric-a-brac 2 [Glossina fuscipes]XP_037894143.1 protein bric-a-brac 2 [Glossina fuscipes]